VDEHYFDMVVDVFDKVMRSEMSFRDGMPMDMNWKVDTSDTDSVEAVVVEMLSSRQLSSRPLHMVMSKSASAVDSHRLTVVPDWEVVSMAAQGLVE
jgi:hypothetical protein